MNTISYVVKERKLRWCDFLSMGKPPQHVFIIQYDKELPPRPLPWPDKKYERIEWAWTKYQKQIEKLNWLKDDSIPYLDIYTGTEIFAEAFGCKVYRPKDDMPFALPLIHKASEVSKLKVPDWSSTPLAMLFEIADELRKRAGSTALLKLVDIQSPMDISSLIWDKNDIYMAFIDAPEAVMELSSKVKELLISFLDEWFARYGTEFIAHFPDYYMPAGITLSEDEVGSVSQEMFIRFFLPELTELSNRYGGIGIHCCANAQHQWDNFMKIPNLRLLNLVQPPEIIKAAYPYFAHHTTQMHSWCGDGPAWTWPKQYPKGSRVVIQAVANTREEALELSEKLWEACDRN